MADTKTRKLEEFESAYDALLTNAIEQAHEKKYEAIATIRSGAHKGNAPQYAVKTFIDFLKAHVLAESALLEVKHFIYP